MAEIKPFITKKNALDSKYRYSGKHITQKENETEKDFKKRVQHETYHFRLTNSKEDYTTIKDFCEKGNKRILIYIQIL